MVKGIYHAAAGMLARQRHLEVTANNLANAATTGFKHESVCFKSALDSTLIASRPTTAGEKFVEPESSTRMLNPGAMNATNNPLDVAIVGEGFFVVETANGLAYTRDGRLKLNPNGELVTISGERLCTVGGTSAVPDGDLRIGPDGSLLIRAADGSDQILDRLQIVTFDDPRKLVHAGAGLYITDQEPIELPGVGLQVGYLEESTVNVISEMTKMIEISQLYDASARAIQTQDSTLGRAVNDVGKL
jgi:flagellar basal body rod protein FlgG